MATTSRTFATEGLPSSSASSSCACSALIPEPCAGVAGGGKGYIPAGKSPVRVQQNPKTPQQASSDAAYRDGYKAGDKNAFSSEKPSGRLANDPQYRRQYAQGHRAAVTERYDTNRSSLKKTMSDWALSRKNSM